VAWAAVAVVAVWMVAEYLALPSAEPLRSGPPPTTALMRQREVEARKTGKPIRRRQQVVALTEIAPVAVSAVVISEDASFFIHEGVDTKEIQKAITDALERGKLRGASTITQQLAKNLWLSTERSPLRKAKELVLTRRLEEALPKKRILTLYLNVAEWGDGVYGIQAAAREHFRTDAAHLTIAQAAMLAGMLPAPRTWLPARRPTMLHRRAARVIGHLEDVGKISPAQAKAARAELDAFFGKPRPQAEIEVEPPPATPSQASGGVNR
jgi:monofunctional biosynthetic peptidoglycan transglycosylase